MYHVFNRGVEKRSTFTDKRELKRVMQALAYYRFKKPLFRFSHFLRLEKKMQIQALSNLKTTNKNVDIICYCLMPNHFHLLLRQIDDAGISKFMANFTNSYTKYFNMKNDRVGPLFQGLFKAVLIEDDEQLMHVSRYIHLNPASSFLVEPDFLESYEWSSYPDYLGLKNPEIIEKETVLNLFSNEEQYKQFVLDQAGYARTLETIKHHLLDE